MTSLALPKSDLAAIPPTAFVLRSRPLRDHIELVTTSRFSDNIWVLTPAVHQVHKRQISLHFLDVPIQFRQTVKELFFALLVIDLPPGHKESRVVTIYARFLKIKKFLVWVAQRGGTALDALTPQDLLDFRAHIKSERNSRGNDLAKLASVRLLWQFRSKLTSGTLPLDPHPLWFDATVHGRRQMSQARENRTPRIPEQVLAPLMTWALRWVEDFADDVLQARSDWADLQATVPDVDRTRGVTTRRLSALLSEYRADRRPLPRVGRTPKPIRGRAPVNLNHLAREAGVHQETIRQQHRYWHLIQEALDDVGLDNATYLRTPIRASLDSEPWLRAVATDDIGTLLRRLQSACYIVIAYLSGMRDAEIKHLERGCLQRWCDEDGEPIRYKLTSQAFKGRTPLSVSRPLGSSTRRWPEPSTYSSGWCPCPSVFSSRRLPYRSAPGASPRNHTPRSTTSTHSLPGSMTTAPSVGEAMEFPQSTGARGGSPHVSSGGHWPGPSPDSQAGRSQAPFSTATTASRCSRATPAHHPPDSVRKWKPNRHSPVAISSAISSSMPPPGGSPDPQARKPKHG